MLNMKTLKVKNKKIYGEWKGVKEDKITKILILNESSSDSESSNSENDDNIAQKEKPSTASKVSSSRNIKYNKSSDSSHVADRTRAKLLQQSDNNLTRGLDDMRITKSAALSMQEIVE